MAGPDLTTLPLPASSLPAPPPKAMASLRILLTRPAAMWFHTHILLHGLHPWLGLGNNREHVSNTFLLEGVVPLQYPLVQPLRLSPASFTIWSPRNSASLLAVEIDVDFWSPYSSSFLLMDLFSAISSNSSESGMLAALLYNTSSQ
ncbi:hypothetical protein E2C01_024353 [Portunus trituberculatus]|uniref:Uncharacterized protein n=1 Tax=Portunus trituberculatus TaxID=210409 RepID=A0A5B7ECK2_PORTR|nr:hypothetical protein [Portunus trituberculatus]